jgi:ribonuclease HI
MILYQIWLARNNARDEERVEEPDGIVRRSIFLVNEWLDVQAQKHKTSTNSEEKHWLPPEHGWCKVNADGAFSAAMGTGGCGVVLRNHLGGFMAGSCHFFPHTTDPERAELEACKRAMLLAKDKGVARIVLETDCMEVVAKLNGKGIDRSVLGPLVEEIKELFLGFDQVLVGHVRRASNTVAHSLAKEGCSNKRCFAWLDSPPYFIVRNLASDMPS